MEPLSLPIENRLPELFGLMEWQMLASNAGLTPRQVQVARLLCLGFSTAEIAGALVLSTSTVRLHIRALFERLDVRDRIGVPVRLVIMARELERQPAARRSSRAGH